MPRTVTLDEFEASARSLVEAVAAGGDSVVVEDSARPVAVLASHASVASMAALADVGRWEGWLREMRESFPAASGRVASHGADDSAGREVDRRLLGFDPRAGVVGSEEGREFLSARLRDLGVPVRDEALLSSVYAAVLQLCEDKERIFLEDLRVLAQEQVAGAPSRFRLRALTIQSTTGLPATAEVTLEVGQGPAMRREQGDGPLDAAIRAIEKLVGLKPEVENFSLVAATRGHDAMAEAVIELQMEDSRAVGAGASTNAVEAGVLAYLNALNFLAEARRPEPAA